MKYFVLIISGLIVLSGCSTNVETNATTNGANSAVVNSPAATNASPPGMQPYNGIQNVNPNAFNASNDNLKVVKPQPKADEMPYGSRTAPDDSTVSSGSRGKDFYEMRTFNSHPVLARVEKIMDGKTTKYKVFLKNGKVLDAPADKMSNYVAMTPENILDIVGMLPKPQTSQPAKPEEKKDQKQQ